MEKEKASLDRRSFIKCGIGGLAGLAGSAGSLSAGAGERLPLQGKTGDVITRSLGRTGLELPVVSMGVMNADNPNVVQAALDSGIVMLDTAYSYQRGRNEEMIGGVIKDLPRDSFILATKVPGRPMDRETGLFTEETKGEDFLEKFDTSLQRLGLDHVDILNLHNITKRGAVLFEPILEALKSAKKSGKTRFIGVTTHRGQPEVIRAAVESKVLDVVICAYNFNQDNKEEIAGAMAEATAAGMGVIAMKTQAGVYWDKEKQEKINMKAALKWALNNPHVTTAIPGFTTHDQLAEDVEVMSDIALTDQDLKDLRLDSARAGLYCQQCETCLPQCPRNLPVPDLMRSYMYAYGYRNLEAAHDVLGSLEIGPDPCRDCDSCSVHCAKGFDVGARVRDIARLGTLPGDFFV